VVHADSLHRQNRSRGVEESDTSPNQGDTRPSHVHI
jgi:hypothetical protein